MKLSLVLALALVAALCARADFSDPVTQTQGFLVCF